jgi:hypothetical protein
MGRVPSCAWFAVAQPVVVVTNGENRVLLPASAAAQFYRLRKP